MNYLHQIKQFWLIHESENFSTDDIAMYFYLLEISNKLNWRNPFKRNNAKIKADLGIKSFDKLATIRKRLREEGLIDFETQNGNANVTYELKDLSTLSKGNTDGLHQGFKDSVSEVNRKVKPELSKVKTEKINLNKAKQSSSTGSLILYQEFLTFFEECPNELQLMLKSTHIKALNRDEINAIILKFCDWYDEQKRISPDFEKNKIALARWFSKEKVFQNGTKTSEIPKKSKEDQFREKGIYD